MNIVLALCSILFLFIMNTLIPEAFLKNPKASGLSKKNKIRKLASTELESKNLAIGQPVLIRIFKKQNLLELWLNNGVAYKLFKKYKICYYSGNLGPKQMQGDHQAPEGIYSLTKHSLNPFSKYHLSFNIGYPNKLDQQLQRTGNYIMVHGGCVSVGCFAMTDDGIEEIYYIVESALLHGQQKIPVYSFPFRFTQKEFQTQKSSKWLKFWKSLEKINNHFEKYKTHPQIRIANGQYSL